MKLVVKFNETLKLVSSQTSYEELLNTIQREFHLRKDSIHLEYIDEEGDKITMGEEEDLQIMKTVHEGKEYVKIYVEGETLFNFSKQKNAYQESSIRFDDHSEIPSEESKMERHIPQDAQLPAIAHKIETSVIEAQEKAELPPKEAVLAEVAPFQPIEINPIELYDSRLGMDSVLKEEKSQTIQNQNEIKDKQLNDKVAKLVDERIKMMLPCLRELLSRQEERPVENYKLIHERIQCNGCLANPIVGIRYECLFCPHFNLCQRCEAKIYHKHNLLKVKQIAGQQRQIQRHDEIKGEKSMDSIRMEPIERRKSKRYSWESRIFNFNEINLDQSQQEAIQKVELKQSQVKKESARIEVPLKPEIKKIDKKVQKEEPAFKEGSAEDLKTKKQMLITMRQIFGWNSLNLKETCAFIDEHFAKGVEHIIPLFMDSQAEKK